MSHNPGPYTPPKVTTRWVNLYDHRWPMDLPAITARFAVHFDTEAEANKHHAMLSEAGHMLDVMYTRVGDRAFPVTMPE